MKIRAEVLGVNTDGDAVRVKFRQIDEPALSAALHGETEVPLHHAKHYHVGRIITVSIAPVRVRAR